MRPRTGRCETGRGGWAAAAIRMAALGFAIATVTACAPAPAWCQGGRRAPASDRLAGLRMGQWIQLDGLVREGAPASCTEVKQLAGDFLDDDWSIKGTVRGLDIVKQEFTVGGCRIQVTGSTTYDDPRGKIKGLGELRIGMLVDVEGTFLRNRSLVAAEVDDESEEMVRRPALRDALEIVGRIERVDLRQRIVTVMGVDFQVSDKTKFRSAIQFQDNFRIYHPGLDLLDLPFQDITCT